MKRIPCLILFLCLASVAAAQISAGPMIVWKADPVYPKKLTTTGDGVITFQAIVNEHGALEDIDVVEASVPEMESPAVSALLKWRFTPAMMMGRPVRASMNIPIEFRTLFGGERSTRPIYARHWDVPQAAPEGVPEPFRYDSPPQPYLTHPAVYPYDYLVRDSKGWAKVAFTIDPTGRPRQFAVAAASDDQFGLATVAMLGSWMFHPATREGRPCWAVIRVKQEFSMYEENIGADEDTREVVFELKRNPSPIVADPSLLDGPLQPLYRPSPIVPEAVVKSGSPARAIIEVVVDKAGRAQAPRIVSGTRDDFSWAAATAAGRWHFTVPVLHGDRVCVFMRLPFEYRPQAPKAEEPEPVQGVSVIESDPGWRDYDPYLATVVERILARWKRIVGNDPDAQGSGGRVQVRFVLNSAGEFARVVWIHQSDSAQGRPSRACLSAIMAAAPYKAWTPAMIAALGNEQELTLDFIYR